MEQTIYGIIIVNTKKRRNTNVEKNKAETSGKGGQ
mgnify:CR=1 FL=1